MRLKLSFLVSGLALFLPNFAQPAAVNLNGACWAGSCASPDVLSPGQSANGDLGWNYTFANGDKYYLSGTYGAAYSSLNGFSVYAFPTAIYLGNVNNAGALSQADVLTFNFLQTFNVNQTANPLADSFLSYNFVSNTYGPIALSSTYTGDASYNGEWIGSTTVGTGYSGSAGFKDACFGSIAYCSSYGYSALPDLTSPLFADELLSLSFGAGSGVGAIISTITPEPSTFVQLSVGVFGLLGIAIAGVRRRTNKMKA